MLISGTGSNLKKVIEYIKGNICIKEKIRINLVISNKEDAPGLNYAKNNLIPYSVCVFDKPTNYRGLSMNEKKELRDAYDMKLLDQILIVGCDII
jgi:folate-dependent phosphoribosylglycinamide formyltransferase PurN